MKRGVTTSIQGMAYDDNVKWWLHQIDRGIRKRKDQEERWDANEAVEDMKQWFDGNTWRMGSGDEPTVNKAGSYIRTYRAAVAYDNPRIKLKPRNAAAQERVSLPVMGNDGKVVTDPVTGEVEVIEMSRVEARERVANDIIGNPMFGLRDTISRVVKASCLGYGVLKIGYVPQFGTPLPKDTDDNVPVLEDGSLDFSVFVTNPMTGLPAEDDDGNPIRKNQIPVWEEWFIDWVHYRDMIIDPDGGNDPNKHRWVAYEEVRTLEEVKADPMFKNTSDLTGTSSSRADDDTPSRYQLWESEEDSAVDLVRLFWVYDHVKDRRLCLADGHGKALLDEEMPLGITMNPFSYFRPNERICAEEEFYPRPIITDLVPLIMENNIARRMLHLGDKRGVRKFLTKKGLFDDEAKDKLTNDNDMELVEFDIDKMGTTDIGTAFVPVKAPDIGGDRYNHLQIIEKDISDIGGIGSIARGGSTNTTATETQTRSMYEGTRYDFDRKQLKDTIVIAFKKLLDSIDANMTVARAITISGEAGMLHEVLVDADMISCDCDIEVDLADMTPTDDAGDTARMLQFAQIIGQNRWMARNANVLRGFANRMRINDEGFIDGLVEAVQIEDQMMQQQAMMEQQAKMQQQGMVPEGGIPTTAGEAQMQTAAGQQVPRMQGAR